MTNVTIFSKSIPVSICCLVTALLLYSFSTSCPHGMGIIEVTIAGLLGFCIFLSIYENLTDNRKLNWDWFLILVISAMIVLFVYPLILIIADESIFVKSTWEILRDIIPYFFLVIPLLLCGMGKREIHWVKTLIPVTSCIVATAFSLRFIYFIINQFSSVSQFLTEQHASYSMAIGGNGIGRDVRLESNCLCLPFDASVLFAACYLPCLGLIKIEKNRPILGCFFLISSLPSILALVLISSRASLALVVLVFLSVYIRILFSSRMRARFLFFISLLFIGFLSVGGMTYLREVIDLLHAKNSAVGGNNKLEESTAIFSELSRGENSLLWGRGWGGEFNDPAVGGKSSFSHSIISYFALKGGLIGVIFISTYFSWIGSRIIRAAGSGRSLEYLALVGSVTATIAISLAFQPNYKTLSFGVLLLCVTVPGPKVINIIKTTSA